MQCLFKRRPEWGSNSSAQGRAKRRKSRSAALGNRETSQVALKGHSWHMALCRGGHWAATWAATWRGAPGQRGSPKTLDRSQTQATRRKLRDRPFGVFVSFNHFHLLLRSRPDVVATWGEKQGEEDAPNGAAKDQPRAERSDESRAAPPWVTEKRPKLP